MKEGANWSHAEAGELVGALIGMAKKPSIKEMWADRAEKAATARTRRREARL
eukprot:SAG22_NODE_6610_length_832_cov_0.729877_2_plen_52_part_00